MNYQKPELGTPSNPVEIAEETCPLKEKAVNEILLKLNRIERLERPAKVIRRPAVQNGSKSEA